MSWCSTVRYSFLILYNIYASASDLPTTPKTVVVDYSDDKVIISTNKDPIVASRNLQNHISLRRSGIIIGGLTSINFLVYVLANTLIVPSRYRLCIQQ